MNSFELCDLFPNKTFNDFQFELEFNRIKKGFENNDEIRIDFRHFRWFDLWSMIQLLFIIDNNRNKKIEIYLLSPEVITNEENKRTASSVLKFLLEMEFLDRAKESGCRVLIQNTVIRNKTPETDIEELRHLFNGSEESFTVSETSKHIIPITKISKLDINYIRENLYIESREVFADFFSELIVEEAGLGDCLLSELVSNVKVHTDGEGYIALRVVGGLRKIKHNNPEKYNNGKSSRINHKLEDWKQFFSERYDDGFFELIVADQGKGISTTISENKPNELENETIKEANNNVHSLLKIAMDPFSSRLTREQRKDKGLTEFTGLGAIINVLTSHNGCLMIREKETRHIFYDSINNHYLFTKLKIKPTKTNTSLHFEVNEAKSFSFMDGSCVTALIPISVHGNDLPEEQQSLSVVELSKDIIEKYLDKIKFFKIVDGDNSNKSYSEKYFEKFNWEFVVKELKKLPENYTSILIDLKNVSVDKNRLWTGFSKIKKVCDKKKLALFVSGLDERLATRLEENISLASKRSKKENPWVFIGFSDEGKVFIFGSSKIDDKKKPSNYSEIGAIFNSFDQIDVTEETQMLLNNSNYFSWETIDEVGNMAPFLKANYSVLNFLLKKNYAGILESHIKQHDSVWIKDQPVELIGGDIVSPYLCIHSITQIKGIYPDLARLIRIISNEFEFDFVLSVGTAARTSIAKDLSDYYLRKQYLNKSNNEPKKVIYYSYQDYFSFDHGEDTKSIITPESKVLIIVDGIRKSENCDEAIDHVSDCGANVIAIIALIDLSGNLSPEKNGIPLRNVLSMPVQANNGFQPKLKEDPYSHRLKQLTQKDDDEWDVYYEQTRAFQFVESFGIIQRGHTVFLDQHLWRGFALSYLFHSKTTLSVELIDQLVSFVKKDQVDAILYPEHSSIGKLVEEVINKFGENDLDSIVCRRVVYPGKSSSYALNNLGKEKLENKRNILIIDDQVFSGNSLKSMVNLCRNYGTNIINIRVYVVIESMLRAEKKLFSTFLQRIHNSSDTRINIKLNAFMRFPVNKYWDISSCPICKLRIAFEKNSNLKNQFIESNYANKRLEELQPSLLAYETKSRKHLSRLEKPQKIRRNNENAVTITTLEGYELYCESIYVQGDIKWLVEGLKPENPNIFPPDVIISVVDLLSQDVSLLFRVRLRKKLIENLISLLEVRELKAKKLSRFLEVLAKFPLYFLKNNLWKQIWESIFKESPKTFYQCYPGAQFLLQEVSRRPKHPLRDNLLEEFDKYVNIALERLPSDVEYKKKGAND
ncbi:MAG: phosphoribosyltransferase [Acidobacteriota bacterium]|nr:phosphoribosyltransferase [Acidobacteriota bacterium]